MDLTEKEIAQIEARGMTRTLVEQQLKVYQEGIPFPDLIRPADIGDGIIKLTHEQEIDAIKYWDEALNTTSLQAVKFVPAAEPTRMFVSARRYLDGGEFSQDVQLLLDNLPRFAFYDALNRACMLGEGGKNITRLMERGEGATVLRYLLQEEGLNYENLPKALLLFHKYEKGPRTAMEEHLVEGAKYIRNSSGEVRIHFVLSEEYVKPFSAILTRRKEALEDELGVRFQVTHSVQKSSTDTITVDLQNRPLRNEEGQLIFRPSGHGALIENLSELDADVIFIKNIDNVVPDYQKCSTIIWKKLLGGYLLRIREKTYAYMELLSHPNPPSTNILNEIRQFLKNTFSVEPPELEDVDSDDPIADYKQAENRNLVALELRHLLNCPIRVCGMLRKRGEEEGIPCIVRTEMGTTSLQILEKDQINPEKGDFLAESQYFNPVDIVCCTKDYRGHSFDLKQFMNPKGGLIKLENLKGTVVKTLERPGLWNGAMSRWNTAFIEVPADTFNPVKKESDLLRPAHQ